MTSYTRRITSQVKEKDYNGRHKLPKVIMLMDVIGCSKQFNHACNIIIQQIHLFLLSCLHNINMAKMRLKSMICLSAENTTIIRNVFHRDEVLAPRKNDA